MPAFDHGKVLTGVVRFAVCDDQCEIADQISNKLREYYLGECEIKIYTDGKSLLADSRTECFDALFLDIGMPVMNGMTLAEKIREENRYVKIIFVTNRDELAHMGYIYGAFRFVRKRDLDPDLRETAESLKKYFDSLNDNLSFKTPSGVITKDVKSIEYFEVNGHYLTMVCGEKSERIYGTMKEYCDSLSSRGFIRVHNSYLVNSKFIYSVEKSSVKLLCGKELPMSRNRADEVRNKYRNFLIHMGR